MARLVTDWVLERGRAETEPLLPLLESNQDSSDPESDVLPITPRGRRALEA